MLEYHEPGKTTQYHGISRDLRDAKAIVLVADEDTFDVFALENPKDLSGVEAFIVDTPCTSLFGVFVPYDHT
jgi:hypothetical protein